LKNYEKNEKYKIRKITDIQNKNLNMNIHIVEDLPPPYEEELTEK
jgi:hypothetical protein